MHTDSVPILIKRIVRDRIDVTLEFLGLIFVLVLATITPPAVDAQGLDGGDPKDGVQEGREDKHDDRGSG